MPSDLSTFVDLNPRSIYMGEIKATPVQPKQIANTSSTMRGNNINNQLLKQTPKTNLISKTVNASKRALPTATKLIAGNPGISIPAGLALAGASWGMHRGAQMDADPLIKNELTELNTLNKAGIIYDDERGSYIDANTFQPVSDDAVNNVLAQQALPTELVVGSNYDEEEAALTNATNELLRGNTPTNKTKNASKQNTASSANAIGTPKTTNKGPNLDWLNALLPFLALGGAYYLGRK